MKPARVLIIAGSDSGGGAGIQADIKTITMMGGHAMTAITAITAQNTLGVTAVHPVPTDIVIAQIRSVISDIGVDAVKIGMIGSAETALAVAQELVSISAPVVLDPVMVATSGSVLADAETIAAMHAMMRSASLTTPNLPELEALGGEAALTRNGEWLLIKGGHGEGDMITDRLVGPDGEVARWSDPRIATTSTHGTGCTLASAIAVGLGQGLSHAAAITRARHFVRMALHGAPGFGAGHGPMGHHTVRLDAVLHGAILNQITLPALDYAASVAFWQAMGLRQIVDSPDNGYARFESAGGATLSIHHADTAPGAATVYLEHADLDAQVKALEAQGFRFDLAPTDQSWGWREAHLADPAGNRVILYHAGENRRYPPWRVE